MAAAGTAVLKTLTSANRTMRYEKFARVIGLIDDDEGAALGVGEDELTGREGGRARMVYRDGARNVRMPAQRLW